MQAHSTPSTGGSDAALGVEVIWLHGVNKETVHCMLQIWYPRADLRLLTPASRGCPCAVATEPAPREDVVQLVPLSEELPG